MTKDKVKFLDYFMKKFSVKGLEMQSFIKCSKKTVYNYRQLSYDELPISLMKKFQNFFNLYFIKTEFNSFITLHSFTEKLSIEDIEYIKVKFNDYIDYVSSSGQSTTSDIKNYDDELSESVDRMTRYYATKSNLELNENQIIIDSKKISSLYLELLEREINNIIKEEDYDFISYLRRYKD